MFFNISDLVEGSLGATGTYTWVFFLAMFAIVTICPMMPRFIINVRELYDRDIRHGWQGVDTGFGVLSQPLASQNAPVSAIAFAEVTPGQESQDEVVEENAANEPETIRLEPFGDNMHQV